MWDSFRDESRPEQKNAHQATTTGAQVNILEYEYTIEQCNVPDVRSCVLREYRQFRRKCLEYLRGDADTPVMNQVAPGARITAPPPPDSTPHPHTAPDPSTSSSAPPTPT